MSAHLLRQDFVPMVAGYLIIMAALGTGLRLHQRSAAAGLPAEPAVPGRPPAGPPAAPAVPGRPPAGPPAAPAVPLRWGRLARHVTGTAAGGYLLLVLVVIGYYYGVARVGGAFIKSAFTGCALLTALALPVFAVLSWLSERRRARATPTVDDHDLGVAGTTPKS